MNEQAEREVERPKHYVSGEVGWEEDGFTDEEPEYQFQPKRSWRLRMLFTRESRFHWIQAALIAFAIALVALLFLTPAFAGTSNFDPGGGSYSDPPAICRAVGNGGPWVAVMYPSYHYDAHFFCQWGAAYYTGIYYVR